MSAGCATEYDTYRLRDRLGEMGRGTLEEAPNAMLDAKAERLCGTGRYEGGAGRSAKGRGGDSAPEPPFKSA